VALAYPSTEEGFGLPPIEAMALGTPVLAAAAMSIPEVCGDGAWLFPPGDDQVLAGLMRKTLAGGQEVEQLVARGRMRENVFSWTRCAQATIDCYEKAVASSHRKHRRRPVLDPAIQAILEVCAHSPFQADRELAAWQDRCLSVENSLREARDRLRVLQPDVPPPPAPPPPPAALATPDGVPEPPRPRFSLRRRLRKIRDGLRRRLEKS
jgi:hypothetical protein